MNTRTVIIGGENFFRGGTIYAADSSSMTKLPGIVEAYASSGGVFCDLQSIVNANTGQNMRPDALSNTAFAIKDTLYSEGGDDFMRYQLGSSTMYDAFVTASVSISSSDAPTAFAASMLESEGVQTIVISDSHHSTINRILGQFGLLFGTGY